MEKSMSKLMGSPFFQLHPELDLEGHLLAIDPAATLGQWEVLRQEEIE